MNAPQPFAELTPHAVLDALADVGLRGDGRLLQLNSYENRVFQAMLEDGTSVVAKFYRAGRWSDAQILEEHDFARELAEAEVPVVAPLVLNADRSAVPGLSCLGTPPTLAVRGALRYAVAPRRAGRAPELDDEDVLEWIGRFIGRMHVVGARRDFSVRRRLDAHSLGWQPRSWLLEHDALPDGVRSPWAELSGRIIERAEQALAAIPELAILRVHGDCHPGNLLWTPDGPHFVDLDDAAMAPAVQDLWMLLPGDADAARRPLAALLEGYEAFRAFDRRELALVEPLRSLRMIHHGAWLAQRWADPAFPRAFPWFGGESYWQQQVRDLQDQLQLMSTAR